MIDLQGRVLFVLPQITISDRQRFDLRSHETTEGIFRRADDRFASYIKTRVDQNRAAGALPEGVNQRIVSGVRFPMDGLESRGIIDVGHSGDRRADYL